MTPDMIVFCSCLGANIAKTLQFCTRKCMINCYIVLVLPNVIEHSPRMICKRTRCIKTENLMRFFSFHIVALGFLLHLPN
jgi:hypothetical protein